METPFQAESPKIGITLGGTEPYKYLRFKIPWKHTTTNFVPVCILTLCNLDVNCSFTENVSVGARDNKMILVNTRINRKRFYSFLKVNSYSFPRLFCQHDSMTNVIPLGTKYSLLLERSFSVNSCFTWQLSVYLNPVLNIWRMMI